MILLDFIRRVVKFDQLPHYEKIRIFAWYLHTHKGAETFDNAAIRGCYREIHAQPPNLSVYLPRMAGKKPPEILREKSGYRLEGSIRRTLDSQYGEHPSVLVVSKLLSDLPTRLGDFSESVFLSEAIDCYRVKAFRAAIVMAWNLAFYHLIGWILSDTTRHSAFNGAIATKYPSKRNFQVQSRDDAAELKESEIIEICRTAKLLSKNLADILREKLKRRNMAAHPSRVVITQSQADDVVTDLVNNVVLALN
jgi:hypothetical protein